MMKKIVLTAVLALTTSLAIAAPVNPATINAIFDPAGKFSFAGTTFVNTGTGEIGSVQQGIGQITSVSDAAGNIIWNNGENGAYLYYVFDEYTIDQLEPTMDPANLQFTDKGGVVNFYASSDNLFNPTGVFATDKNLITAGSLLFLTTTAQAYDAAGHTIYGTKGAGGAGAFTASNGTLNVTGGTAAEKFDTNSFKNGADLSFTISGDTVTTAGYIGRGSVSGTGVTIPEPTTMMLLGLGLMVLGYTRKTA